MGRPKQFDRNLIAKYVAAGFTAEEIAQELGAKSPTHIRTIVRKLKRDMRIEVGRPSKNDKALDVGKVRALQRAGWSIGKIYYELGMMYPVEEIRKAMKKEEKQK